MPRAGTKGPFATLPALTEAKLALYTAMRTAKVSKADKAEKAIKVSKKGSVD